MTGPEPALPAAADPPRSYRIVIPRLGKRWLTANQRLHYHAKARLSRQWRDVAAWRCRQMGVTFGKGARVVCELRFHGNRRRDPANWNLTAKPVIDGLVDAGIFPDDTPRYVTGPDMRLGEPVATKADEELIVHIFPRQETST